MSSDETIFTCAPPFIPNIQISGDGGRVLLTIHPNGTVEGEIEDASEAARRFVEHVRGMVEQPAQSDIERVARALAQADGIEICSDATYALSSYGHKAEAALAALRQPTQSDALLDAEGVKLYWYRQGKDDGVEHERAKIVAWLRKEAIMSTDTVRRRMNKALDQIEAGEHLK